MQKWRAYQTNGEECASDYYSAMETAGDVQSIGSLSDGSELRSASSTALNEETCVVASGECRPGPRLEGRPAARKEDQQARYWSYLFDNLHRVVDEIYCTCEADQSVIECEEMMMTLDVCKKDFETLSRRIEVEQGYDGTQNKLAAVSWEIRLAPKQGFSLSARVSSTEAQSITGAGHVRHLHFPSTASAPVVLSPKASNLEREERDPTPIAALFTQQGFELASTVSLTHTDQPASPLPIGYLPPEPSQSAGSESGLSSVPVVRKSHGGKVQVYVDIPADAPPSFFSREPLRELPDSQMMEEIEAQNPPDEGWEVVQPRSWRLSEKRKRSQEDSCSQHSAGRTTENGTGSVVSLGADQPLAEGGGGVSTKPSLEERKGGAPEPAMNFAKAVVGGSTQALSSGGGSEGGLDSSPSHLNSDEVLSVPPSPGAAGKSPSWRVQLQQKLSSPQRRWEVDSEKSRQLLDEKLAKAQVQRDKLKEERAQRLRDISHKIQGVRQLRDCEIEKRRVLMVEKLERAKTLRDTHIQEIIRKAQAEDVKKNEIAFINSLEAQNKRIEVLERHLGDEARLHDLQEGRQRKREEQQAKEEAALERRRTMEADRLARMQEMHQRRQEQDLKREQRRNEMERAREEAAKEKAKERERKLAAHMTALQSSAEELERKIQLKHDESAKRYDLQLEQIREKAALISRHTSAEDSLKVTPYERMKWCTVCHVKIVSELYLMAHLRSKQHLEATASLTKQAADLSALITELPDETSRSMYDEVVEKLKGNKKRLKKLRARMATRVKALEAAPPPKADLSKLPSDQRARLQKLVRELNKLVDACGESPWPSSQLAPLDRILGEVVRYLSGRSQKEKAAFAGLQGMATVARALSQLVPAQENGRKATHLVPLRSVSLMANVLKATCQGCNSNCVAFVTANQIQPVVDVLIHLYLVHIKELSSVSAAERERREVSRDEELCAFSALLSALAEVYSTLASTQSLEAGTAKAALDSISYIVAVGVFDCMLASFRSVCGPLEDRLLAELLVSSLNLLIAVSAYLHMGLKDVFAVKQVEDTTQFLEVMQRTELFGVPSLLYAVLLHAGAPRHSHPPPTLPEHTITMATAAMKLMNNVALINLHAFQLCLGDDSISLQFRGITSYLIWHCKHMKNEVLLQELITAVGYFCVLNVQNQALLKSGHSPTLIQLLCTLPFEYFSSPRLVELLFPTLISACYKNKDNRIILEQEISCQLLVVFIRDQLAKRNHQSPETCSDSSVWLDGVDTIRFQNRFPPDQWEDALAFFTASTEQGQ